MLVKDMFDKNGHNPSCGFAGDIVSYLYDEADAAEKAKFEAHLAGCTMCGDELAAFSNARSSMIEWREAEFGWLPSPDIVIPYEKTEAKPLVLAQTRGTILTDLKRLFSFTPWPPALAAFGALVIFAGLAFVGFTYFNGIGVKDLASDNVPKRSDVAAPDPSDIAPARIPAEEIAGNAPAVDIVQPEPERPVADTRRTSRRHVEISKNVVVPQKVTTPEKKERIEVAANKDEKDTHAGQKQKAPTLSTYTEEEDTTLRLADLFAETGSME